MTTPRTNATLEATALVDARWLDEHLDDPSLRVVEVDVSLKPHQEGHIPGAVLWNVYANLKDADYRLVDPTRLQALLERSGITPESTVVLYGYAPAMGLWLLDLMGHDDARVLDASRAAWVAAGRPWTDAPSRPSVTCYPLGPLDDRIRADRVEVTAAVGRSGCTIVDTRTQPEYDGERFWPSGASERGGRTGHVPGAIRVPVEEMFDDLGSFLPAERLRELVAPIDPDGDDEVITYCTIGGRASTLWFVLTRLLGRRNVRVYDGSWAEWGRLPDTPIA
jgi:thiosulfate/3-mercaptopyruvate sulfurtransferase